LSALAFLAVPHEKNNAVIESKKIDFIFILQLYKKRGSKASFNKPTYSIVNLVIDLSRIKKLIYPFNLSCIYLIFKTFITE